MLLQEDVKTNECIRCWICVCFCAFDVSKYLSNLPKSPRESAFAADERRMQMDSSRAWRPPVKNPPVGDRGRNCCFGRRTQNDKPHGHMAFAMLNLKTVKFNFPTAAIARNFPSPHWLSSTKHGWEANGSRPTNALRTPSPPRWYAEAAFTAITW